MKDTPGKIYLVDMGGEVVWCEERSPDASISETDSVEYIRADCAMRPAPCETQCEAKSFEIEIRRLRIKMSKAAALLSPEFLGAVPAGPRKVLQALLKQLKQGLQG